jgi:hypothetical protein
MINGTYNVTLAMMTALPALLLVSMPVTLHPCN